VERKPFQRDLPEEEEPTMVLLVHCCYYSAAATTRLDKWPHPGFALHPVPHWLSQDRWDRETQSVLPSNRSCARPCRSNTFGGRAPSFATVQSKRRVPTRTQFAGAAASRVLRDCRAGRRCGTFRETGRRETGGRTVACRWECGTAVRGCRRRDKSRDRQ